LFLLLFFFFLGLFELGRVFIHLGRPCSPFNSVQKMYLL
jgi:hypothetical protein